MQRITIREEDHTTNTIDSSLDIGSVLIPGFATNGPVMEPVEVTSLAEFLGTFRDVTKSEPKFNTDQAYPIADENKFSQYNLNLEDAKKKLGLGNSLEGREIWIYGHSTKYKVGDYCLYDNYIWYCITANEYKDSFNQDNWQKGVQSGIDEASKIFVKIEDKYYTYINPVISSTEGTRCNPQLTRIANEGFSKDAIPVDEAGNIAKMYKQNDIDLSWTMAKLLLTKGIPVTYIRMNKNSSEITVERAYEALKHIFIYNTEDENCIYQDLLDKGAYNIQFITSGGYPTFEYGDNSISQGMLSLAANVSGKENMKGRGDCVALIDHTNNPDRPLIGNGSVFSSITTNVGTSSFGSMFTPWCETTDSTETNPKYVPGSFIYLYTFASHFPNLNSWSIYAGTQNGRCSLIKGLHTKKTLTNRIAEEYQNSFGKSDKDKISINAITYIRNYGYCIWGNRTLENYASDNPGFALSFLNIRNLVSEVKKVCFFTAQELMFSVNGDLLWQKFKSKVDSVLSQMVSGYGLKSYKIIRLAGSTVGAANYNQDKTKLSVAVVLYPAYGIESVDVVIDLRDEDDISVYEESSEEV